MSRFLWIWCFLLTPLLLFSGCMATLPKKSEPPAGTYRVATGTRYNALRRTFLLHIPPGYRPDTPLPLVVVVHGAFSTANKIEKETGFSALADVERFLVAYPEGIGLFGLFQHWNAGHCCGRAAAEQADDVGFLAEVICTVRSRLAVDPARIYMAGMSNGGMLTYRFAAERSEDLAAAAVVSGAIGSTVGTDAPTVCLQQPDFPVPMIVFHGLEDDAIPAKDGNKPRKKGKRSFLPAANAVDFWRTADGCAPEPMTEASNSGFVRHLAWSGCLDGSSVEYYLLAGWGHEWPAPWFSNRLDADHPLHGFDATRRIWEFFTRFRRYGS
jgi:polyhydroxybutyrate depolymerase